MNTPVQLATQTQVHAQLVPFSFWWWASWKMWGLVIVPMLQFAVNLALGHADPWAMVWPVIAALGGFAVLYQLVTTYPREIATVVVAVAVSHTVFGLCMLSEGKCTQGVLGVQFVANITQRVYVEAMRRP
jgi:hypothetical protein